MEKDLRILTEVKIQIEKGLINFKKSPKERITENYVESRLEILEKTFENFVQKYERMIGEYGSESVSTFFQEDVFETTSEHYLIYKTELKNSLSKFKNIKFSKSCDVSSDKTKDESMVKLPQIKIPIFSGKYTEWTSFSDLFKSLIHNNTALDDVQRLHYLKTQLSGEAEQLIRHVPITKNNYKQCWEMLENRYNNKKFMSTCILKRLFSQRNILFESANSLKELLDVTTDCLHELSNLGIDISTWDVIVVYVTSLKLDVESRKQWELHVSQSSEDLPSWQQFRDFLETRFRALEFIEPKAKPRVPHNNNTSNPKVMHSLTAKLSCPHCSEEHKLYNCKAFSKEDVDQRRDIARSLGVCFNCLAPSHSAKSCKASTKCRICHRRHHSLLHLQSQSIPNAGAISAQPAHTQVNESTQPEISTNIATHFLKGNAKGQVLLATALIKAESKDGSSQILRALLDQGSQASFITEAAVQLLRLKKVATTTTIAGIGGVQGGARIVSKYVVCIHMQSLHNPSFTMKFTAHVLSSLTSVMPDSSFKIEDWPEIHNIQLADPIFNSPNKIDVLLGADVYCNILQEGLIKSPTGSVVAQATHLGWIVSGFVGSEESSHNRHNAIMTMHTQVEVNDMLKRLWELDSEPILAKHLLTPEEAKCEEYFRATTQRDETGRYIVRLPFRSEDPPCKYGQSKLVAVKRFQGLERKFARDVNFKQQYAKVMDEYLSLGHLHKITEEAERNQNNVVYLPHHAVVRNDKITTKFRVVFDASCKGTNGVSLNDTLMVGPTLQADLRHTVMRWRQHPVCLTADIVKMYRQIKVAEDDQDYQRIVWREDPFDEMQDYRLSRVTFGTSCAPYLAVKSLQQVACDEGKSYPLAAEKVMSDFYMDDLMTGCLSETDAVKLYRELNELLEKGGFKLQKWSSNRVRWLEDLQEDSGEGLEIKTDNVSKVLGLTWNRSTDEFDYSVKLPPPTAPETKRSVISEISSLYDPLGWIAPCIITSKAFIQKLWIAGLSWDDELSPELLHEWRRYREDLELLINFHIPRWIGSSDNNVSVELHAFGDASNVGFSSVIYCRIMDSDGKIYCNLITAKTKVAPIKQVSIPRLELNGALLTARLLTETAEVMKIPKSNLHAWTDSSVVLAWLSDHPSRWKTYVANRTAEILNLLDSSQWAHVQSKDNPADIASRGVSPSILLESDLWKRGPNWLQKDLIIYSRPEGICTKLEKKAVKTFATNTVSDGDDYFWSRFSSLRKLIRVVAFCRRFLLKIKHRKEKVEIKPYLSASEIRDALRCCIKKSQQRWFHEEMNYLSNKQSLHKKSTLYKLTPFLDESGLLRVGGRIKHCQLPDNAKHPVIIHHDSFLTRLIVADAHERTFHGGQQLVLNFIRTRYWIPRIKQVVRAHIHNCVPCIRYAAKTTTQLMGDLPACRVTPSKVFLHSGVDNAGPFQFRVSKGRGQRSYKGYICLFVCMATRAVHLEAVSDLTTEGFLACFKRFVSRRGHCRHIWSDNGSNFSGAAKELKMLFAQESSTMGEIAAALANSQTEWHHIPPHAPNFGGVWEAGIKSVKHHLKRVIGDSTLTYEEMSTVLSQIEACLNSRPLSQGTSDPEDPTPLTPGHFLVGHPLVVPPDYNFEYSNMNILRRWQLVQRMVQSFWRRWNHEYLTHFFQRHKWAVRTPDLRVGDVVLVKEENLPPAKWLYGRIVQLHPGQDNITRVVSLRCKNTVIKRPASKLCLIPANE